MVLIFSKNDHSIIIIKWNVPKIILRRLSDLNIFLQHGGVGSVIFFLYYKYSVSLESWAGVEIAAEGIDIKELLLDG